MRLHDLWLGVEPWKYGLHVGRVIKSGRVLVVLGRQYINNFVDLFNGFELWRGVLVGRRERRNGSGINLVLRL